MPNLNQEETIASNLGTDQEVANGLACSDCRHILNDEHEENTCYGLVFNGTVWISCKCKRFKSGFDIKIDIYESSTKENRKETESKPKKSITNSSSNNLQKTIIPTFKKVS